MEASMLLTLRAAETSRFGGFVDPFESLIDAFFRAVSFEAGEWPDYDAIRGLFIERGLLIRALSTPPEVSPVDEFIAARWEQLRSGRLTAFAETEVSAETQVFGNVAQRWSAYTKRGTLDGMPFAARGTISTQFVRTSPGWLITSMAWDDAP
jgi:hypothetical protein